MTFVSHRWSLLDQASAVHALHCESVRPDRQPDGLDLDVGRTDNAVLAYGFAARRIYDDLKRAIGQAAGLLILAQASARRDAFDLPSLEHAEEVCGTALDRIAALPAPGRLDAHRDRLLESGQLVRAILVALRDVRSEAGAPDLAETSQRLAIAYRLLQSASESRFGMTMVDFRHGCCTCGLQNKTS